MANTEILKVLQVVRDAKRAVNEALFACPGETALEELSTLLEDAEGTLIASALDDKVSQLRQYQQQLEGVNRTIKGEVQRLKDVSEKVSRAAKALGILADLVGNAAAIGVL